MTLRKVEWFIWLLMGFPAQVQKPPSSRIATTSSKISIVTMNIPAASAVNNFPNWNLFASLIPQTVNPPHIKPPNTGNAPTTGNTKENIKVNIRKEPGSETFSGSITVKIGDNTYTAKAQGQTSERAVKDALKIALRAKGLSDDQVDKAIREAKPAKPET